MEPKAWVGCLACYNAGRLVGEWVDGEEAGERTPEDIHGRPTSHEELWVMDHEGYGGALSGECSPMEAQRIAVALAESDDPEAFAAWISDEDGDIDDPGRFADQYRGEWDSLEEYLANMAEECAPSREVAALLRGECDVWPLQYMRVDWEAVARDANETAVETGRGTVYVFDPAA
jgi:antirestriction protein